MKLHLLPKKLILNTIILLLIWFGGWELIEHLWLIKHFKDFLPVIQIIRGVLAVVLMVILILWYFFHFQLPLYPKKKKYEGIIKQTLTDKNILRYHAHWLINARWFAATIIGIIVYAGCYLFGFLEKDLFSYLIITTFSMIVFNSIFFFVSKLKISFENFIVIQLITDLIILTILLHFSGGIENPLTFIYLFHVVISGILLDKKKCYLITALACFLFITMALGEMTNIFNHYTLTIFPYEYENEIRPAYQSFFVFSHIITQLSIFILTAYFITEIIIQLKQARRTAFIAAQKAIEENEKLIGVIKAARVGLAVLDNRRNLEWIKPIPQLWEPELEHLLRMTILKLSKNNSSIRLSANRKYHEKSPHVEKEYHAKNGNVYTYQISLFPLKKKKSKSSSIAALIQNVTEQKDIMAQLIQASKMSAIGELAGNFAHEINNPVGIISSKSRLLLSNFIHEIPVKVKSEIKKIINLSDRITYITKGLLRFSRPSIKPRSEVNINEAILHTIELMEHSLKTSKIKLELDINKSALPVVGNLNELEQIFLNIITNAKDAMSRGGKLNITSKIEHRKKNHDMVLVKIQDIGTGINPLFIDRIFEPFFTTKEIGKGTGLGLPICKGIIENYGGSIIVESKIDYGTTFFIRLPYNKRKRRDK